MLKYCDRHGPFKGECCPQCLKKVRFSAKALLFDLLLVLVWLAALTWFVAAYKVLESL